MKLQRKFLFGLLISIILFMFLIGVNLVVKKDSSGELIKEMDDSSGLQEIIEEMKAPSCRQEMIQEMEDPLSVLFNNTWLSEAEPKWWMSFEENLIKLGPYPGGIDLLEKFDVVEVDGVSALIQS